MDIKSLKLAHQLRKTVIALFKDINEINTLAKNSILPHFRLTNPLTSEVKYLFDTESVINYMEKNCLSEISGKQLSFLSFTETSLPYRNDNELPDELKGMTNSVYNLPCEYLNTPSGIYFLYYDKELVYIGQSVNITGRVVTHWKEQIKDFNKIYFIRVDLASLNSIETKLINKFKPKYNKR